MRNRSVLTIVLLCAVALMLGLLLGLRPSSAAQAQVSEGRAGDIIAVANELHGNSLLYLVDCNREVVLVYGFVDLNPMPTRDLRNGVFEFLAGRLYRWDALLASKREYQVRGWGTAVTYRGLRPSGPRSSEEEYKRVEK